MGILLCHYTGRTPQTLISRSHSSQGDIHLQKSFISRSHSSQGDIHLQKSFIASSHSSPGDTHLQETLISTSHSSPEDTHLQESSNHHCPLTTPTFISRRNCIVTSNKYSPPPSLATQKVFKRKNLLHKDIQIPFAIPSLSTE